MSDKRDIHFTDERKQKPFQGEGHVLHDGRVVFNNSHVDHLPPIQQGVRTESNDQRNRILLYK